MPWVTKRSPLLPTPPAYHDPKRCMNCGHSGEQHNAAVGCLADGGTKYIEETDSGMARHACSCEKFIPAPAEPKEVTP